MYLHVYVKPLAASLSSNLATILDLSGPSDCLLTGQRLLDRVFSNSAELHAFASTSKRPPERHDAFTNTDSGESEVLTF